MSEVVSDIPFTLDLDALGKRAHVEPGTSDAKEFADLVHRAEEVVRPKAIYREAFIESKGEDTVTVEGVTFSSRALRKNLDEVERVFAYVATCGAEADEIEITPGDVLAEFWLDTIKAALLGASTRHLAELLSRKYGLGKTATMNPGAGDATVWPIEQQTGLFSLLGDVEGLIGVRLTDSFLMMPNKSVSGIRFASEVDFKNCQLCHREDCPGRRAPFDKALWDSLRDG